MLNHVDLMGRLTDEPQRRGDKIVTFSLACKRNYANHNGEYDTDFFDIAVFGTRADFALAYLHKGQLIVIDGRLTLRKWSDASGGRHQQVSVVADHLHTTDSKSKNPETPDELGAREREPGENTYIPGDDDYDLPDDYYIS